MPSNYLIAGQAAPAANTDTELYLVVANSQFVQSTLTVLNRNLTSNGAFRIAVVKSGEVLANKHYIEFERLLAARGSLKLTLGMSLSAGDKVIVRASSVDFSFSLFGCVITP